MTVEMAQEKKWKAEHRRGERGNYEDIQQGKERREKNNLSGGHPWAQHGSSLENSRS